MNKQHSLNVLPKWARDKILALEKRNAELSRHPIVITVYDVVSFTQEKPVMTMEGYRLQKQTYNLQSGDYLSLTHPDGVAEQLMVIKWGKAHEGVHRWSMPR